MTLFSDITYAQIIKLKYLQPKTVGLHYSSAKCTKTLFITNKCELSKGHTL